MSLATLTCFRGRGDYFHGADLSVSPSQTTSAALQSRVGIWARSNQIKARCPSHHRPPFPLILPFWNNRLWAGGPVNICVACNWCDDFSLEGGHNLRGSQNVVRATLLFVGYVPIQFVLFPVLWWEFFAILIKSFHATFERPPARVDANGQANEEAKVGGRRGWLWKTQTRGMWAGGGVHSHYGDDDSGVALRSDP